MVEAILHEYINWTNPYDSEALKSRVVDLIADSISHASVEKGPIIP